MPMRIDETRRQLFELMSQRANHLNAAMDARANGDQNGYTDFMARATAMNAKIDDCQQIVNEYDRYAAVHAPVFGGGAKDLEEMGRALAAGQTVKMSVSDMVKRGIVNSTTVASGGIVEPVGADANIRDGHTAGQSALIDQVYAQDVTGMGAYEVPYTKAEQAAQGGKVTTTAGTARTATDPTFRSARINPYEVSVTSYVDRNLSRLSPANYSAKVQELALRALRRKVNALIVNGDGQASPDMFGILNAKNTSGENIFASVALGTAIDADTIDTLVYAYGGNEELGGAARLLISKRNLQAIGKLRGTNEKKRLYNVVPDAANPNTGVITDGGMVVPYTICSAIGDATIAYGDPMNYELGLFGDYTIRIDESYKAAERMNTILGDIMVGGNLTFDGAFVVGTIGE